jgi:flagellar motor switch protein FliG
MSVALDTPGIRKAAILVASLDREAGDLVLDRMAADEAHRVRQTILDLGPLDAEEQRRVVDEFRGGGSAVRTASEQHYPPGIELDGRLAEILSGSATSETRSPESAPPFQFLRETESGRLVRILAGERPQVIALVLSHLPPQGASEVLASLPAVLQADVIHRLVDLGQPDPAVVREVERGLESRLSETAAGQAAVTGLPAVADILKAAGPGAGRKIIENLATHAPALADQLGPPRMDFEDLGRLGDEELRALLAVAELDVVGLALLGLAPPRVDRWLSLLPGPEAERVRRQLARPMPTRLSDVDEARYRLTELARRLALEGQLTLAPANG